MALVLYMYVQQVQDMSEGNERNEQGIVHMSSSITGELHAQPTIYICTTTSSVVTHVAGQARKWNKKYTPKHSKSIVFPEDLIWCCFGAASGNKGEFLCGNAKIIIFVQTPFGS